MTFPRPLDEARDGSSEPMSLVERMFHLSASFAYARALWIVAKLGVADLLAEGPRSVASLAEAIHVPAQTLHRVLRVVASTGALTEVEPARFALTPFGELLRSDVPDSMRGWVVMTGGPIFRSFVDAMYSVETGKPAFERVFGAQMYDYYKEHPDDAAAFNAAMVAYGGQAAGAVVEAYDFTGLNTIVDVGAGPGTLLKAVLDAHPEMRGVLFDLPNIVELARQPLAEAGLSERCKVEGGSFLEAVPTGGDVYVLSSILHNWDDEQAITILRNCRRAMKSDGRLLVVEMVIPANDAPHFVKPTDMVMLVALGGRERTAQEYAELLAKAGFRLTRVVATRFMMSVLEALPEG